MDFLILFIIITIINVVFSTARSIVTIKCGKYISSVVCASYFAFYNIVIIYTVADYPMWQKCLITFVCNLIGVYAVKLVEEKIRKEKLWKVEATVLLSEFQTNKELFEMMQVPHYYIEAGKYVILNFYCATKQQSSAVKMFLADSNAKYFVSESQDL